MQNYTDFLSRKARAHGATLSYIGKRYVVSFHGQSIPISDEASPSVRNLRNLADMMVAVVTPGLFHKRHFTHKRLELPDAKTVRVWVQKNRSALEALSGIFTKSQKQPSGIFMKSQNPPSDIFMKTSENG
ncbi:MAG: hypothetical protein WC295_07370 [Methanoregula sp.]